MHGGLLPTLRIPDKGVEITLDNPADIASAIMLIANCLANGRIITVRYWAKIEGREGLHEHNGTVESFILNKDDVSAEIAQTGPIKVTANEPSEEAKPSEEKKEPKLPGGVYVVSDGVNLSKHKVPITEAQATVIGLATGG